MVKSDKSAVVASLMARDRTLKPCRRCNKEWGIVEMTRSDAECELHHRVGLCEVHGGIDCDGSRDNCPGSYAARTR